MSSVKQLDACINWCKNNGATIDDSVEFKITGTKGITAVASGILSTEAPLIRIPKKLLITNELAKEKFGVTEENIFKTNPNALVQLYVAKLKFDQTEESFYSPYIDMLPLKLEQPYFWNSEEIEILKGTDLYLLLRKNLEKLVREWYDLLSTLKLKPEGSDLYKEMNDSNNFDVFKFVSILNHDNETIHWNSFRAYLWASGVFSSRAFPKLIIDDHCSNINEAFLYPIVDLLNHKNGVNVKWVAQNDQVCFITQEVLKKGDEIFNNYGDKSNEDLLLSYGFTEDNNQCDFARLTLKLDGKLVSEASKYVADLNDDNIVADNCVQFELSAKRLLPSNLVNFFAYLCRLTSEPGLTLRNILEGQDKLHSILMQKFEFFKIRSKIDTSKYNTCDARVIQTARKYFNCQKKLFNGSLEALQKLQKEILKKKSPLMITFKTLYKSDKPLANSLLISFGVTKFEELITKNCMREALLLWIVRMANRDSYPHKLEYTIPQFIYDTFQEVSASIIIEKDDVSEFMDFHKKLFPSLTERIPEVFGPGNWGVRQFIVADTVMDRLVWTRNATKEPFFIETEPFNIS